MDLKDQKAGEVKWVECDVCEKWHHIACIGLDDKDYEFLKRAKKNNKHIFWLCSDCKVASFEVMKAIAEVKEKHEKIEKEMCIMKTDTVKLECGVEKLKVRAEKIEAKQGQMEVVISQLKQDVEDTIKKDMNKINEKFGQLDTSFQKIVESRLTAEVESKIEKQKVSLRDIMRQEMEEDLKRNINEQEIKFSKVVESQVEQRMGTVSHEVHEQIKESQEYANRLRDERAEQEDIESRRCNIVLYRVRESDELLAENRKKSDLKTCEQFLSKLNVGVDAEDIRKLFRLGKRNENSTLPRPILIQLGSRHVKNLVMESLYKVKSMEADFKDIIVAHDMTEKQRELGTYRVRYEAVSAVCFGHTHNTNTQK